MTNRWLLWGARHPDTGKWVVLLDTWDHPLAAAYDVRDAMGWQRAGKVPLFKGGWTPVRLVDGALADLDRLLAVGGDW